MGGESLGLDADDDGVGLELGLRSNLTDRFELNGHVRYSQVLGLDLAAEEADDVLDDAVLFGIGGLYHVTDLFSIGAGVETGDAVSAAWFASARVEFR